MTLDASLELLEAATEALLAHLELCIVHSLSCSDPPLFTSGFLESLGYTGYKLRRVLREAKRARSITAYASPYTVFTLVPRVVVGTAYFDPYTRIPLDPLDCSKLNSGCSIAPRTTMFYAYLEGRYGGEEVKANIVHLAVIVEKLGMPVKQILRDILDCFHGREPTSRANMLLEKSMSIAQAAISQLTPESVRDSTDILRRSPGLRRLFTVLRETCGFTGPFTTG